MNTLAYLTKMAQKSTATTGQLAGLNTRFQTGLAEVKKYLASTEFNQLHLAGGQAVGPGGLGGRRQIRRLHLQDAATGRQFRAEQPAVRPVGLGQLHHRGEKGGVTTNVVIDLHRFPGGLTLGNVISYVNGQLVRRRLHHPPAEDHPGRNRHQRQERHLWPAGVAEHQRNHQLLRCRHAGALHGGQFGSATETNTVTNIATSAATTSVANQAGRLTKLSGLDGSPSGVISANQQASTGTTTAERTVVDATGNVYVIGTASGNFGSQLNQGTQDVYLTKYDSAGRQTWSKLLGSAGTASASGWRSIPRAAWW